MWGTPKKPEEQQGERFREADAWNRVLIIRPTEYVEKITALNEEKDALRLSVVDLAESKLYSDVLWFSAPLIGLWKRELGTPFLGYITKEKNSNGYMAWTFKDLQTDPQWDAAAQAYLAQHPEFLAPLGSPNAYQPRDTSHHEQGPAPDWAGAVPQAPAGPPAPPRPGAGGPPAPPAPPGAAPGFAPPTGPPAPPAAPGGGGDLMARLRATAAGLPAPEGNVGNGDVEPPY